MLFPQVTFKLNKALDKKMALEFLDLQQGGVNFLRGIIGVHPELKNIKEINNKTKRGKIISNYFDSFYKEHRHYLSKRVREADKTWREVAGRFFDETKKLFRGHPFPPGKYVGYLSTIDCNPRFLEDKTFQVFYLHQRGFKYVTAHELLHFIFYDYVLKKYPEVFMNMDTERGIFWDLAELFNSIILHTPTFVEIHQTKRSVTYPKHTKYFSNLSHIWKKYQDVDKFITISYKLLKKEGYSN